MVAAALDALVSVVSVLLVPLDTVVVRVCNVQIPAFRRVYGHSKRRRKAVLELLVAKLRVVGVGWVPAAVDDADRFQELERRFLFKDLYSVVAPLNHVKVAIRILCLRICVFACVFFLKNIYIINGECYVCYTLSRVVALSRCRVVALSRCRVVRFVMCGV